MALSDQNEYGLTYAEWLEMAGCDSLPYYTRYRWAWRAGEDPGEWRAHFDALRARRFKQEQKYQQLRAVERTMREITEEDTT